MRGSYASRTLDGIAGEPYVSRETPGAIIPAPSTRGAGKTLYAVFTCDTPEYRSANGLYWLGEVTGWDRILILPGNPNEGLAPHWRAWHGEGGVASFTQEPMGGLNVLSVSSEPTTNPTLHISASGWSYQMPNSIPTQGVGTVMRLGVVSLEGIHHHLALGYDTYHTPETRQRVIEWLHGRYATESPPA